MLSPSIMAKKKNYNCLKVYHKEDERECNNKNYSNEKNETTITVRSEKM